jgi:hypothetical protein
MPSYKPILPYQNYGQIIPDHKYSSSTVVINDNTQFFDIPSTAAAGISALHVFVSPHGRDGVVQTIANGLVGFLNEYGIGPISVYGQPLANAYATAASGGAIAHCLRVTAQDAKYSTLNIIAHYQFLTTAATIYGTDYPANSLLVYYTAEESTVSPASLDVDDLLASYPNTSTAPDADGFSWKKVAVAAYVGRGTFGQNVSIRFISDAAADKTNPFKNYTVQFVSNDGGRYRSEAFSVVLSDDAFYQNVNYSANSIINDPDTGSDLAAFACVPENIQEIANLWLEQYPAGTTIYSLGQANLDITSTADYAIGDTLTGTVGTVPVTITVTAVGTGGEIEGWLFSPETSVDDFASTSAVALTTTGSGTGAVLNSITTTKQVIPSVTIEDFDLLFGLLKNGNQIPFLYELTAPLVDPPSPGIDLVDLQVVGGLFFKGGSEGTIFNTDGTLNQTVVDNLYLLAFNGDIDPFIVSKNKFPTNYILDANYSNDVKLAMYQLAIKREDCRVVIDVGINTRTKQAVLAFSNNAVGMTANNWIATVEGYNGKIRDPFNNKVVNVTGTYALAYAYPRHYLNYGGKQVPFAGNIYGIIEDYFIKDSIYPVFDEDIDSAIMDQLVEERVNFARNNINQVIIRSSQTTRQEINSALSEENNVSIVLDIKREVLRLCARYDYNFAEPSDLARFTGNVEDLAARYRDTQVRSISAMFDQNSWEAERSIIHLHVDIVYKGLVKTSIIEMNLNRGS